MSLSLFLTLPFGCETVNAETQDLDPNTKVEIQNYLYYMSDEFSKLYPNHRPGYGPLTKIKPLTEFETDNISVNHSDIITEPLQPIHVATSKFTNHTNETQKFQTQEYSESYTNSITNTTTHTFKAGVDTKGTIDIVVAKLDTTLKVEYNFASSEANTQSETKTYSMKSQGINVKPHQTIQVIAKLERAKISTDLDLGVDLYARVPVAESITNPNTYLHSAVGSFVSDYRSYQDLGVIPYNRYAGRFKRIYRYKTNPDGKENFFNPYARYTGGHSKVIADVGTSLVVDIYDITNGEDNPQLLERRVSDAPVLSNE